MKNEVNNLKKLFGTDGIRGVANEELTGELVFKIGRAGGYFITNNVNNRRPVIIIGKDTRISGDMLESALIAGITSAGIDVIKLGIIPTPGVSYLSKVLDVDGGVMISASHNPIADNGIKFFDGDGYKLSDEMEQDIEKLIFNDYDKISFPTHNKIGKLRQEKDYKKEYIDYIIKKTEHDFSGLKIVIDCANGAAYDTSPEIFEKLGAELIVINNHPDGGKINLNCGSTHPEIISKSVLENNADLGIAHDGDADRVIMVDENGKIVDGDKIMAICALDYLKNGKLKNKTLVTTKYSNMGLKELIENNGGRVIFTKNGDRYVLKEMLSGNFNLGGEKSGHIIFLDYNQTGDGIMTAIQLVQVVKTSSKPLSELAAMLKEWPQRLKNIEVKHKDNLKSNKTINKYVKLCEEELAENGRLFLRASGTEPVVRLMLEGKDEQELIKWENVLADIINNELN